MSTEFTGERVIPGQVDVDLWNEHLSRYAFAARLARRKRVLDVGCGAGYGSAELANTAAQVTGIDIGEEAIAYASSHYSRGNVSFQVAGATALPFADGSFDLVVAFEVIEHLAEWEQLILEARRVLSPGGQFVVSTPNKGYYAESRRLTGPNPYHAHEFEYDEFKEALERHFPHTLMFTENHADSIVFRPIANGGTPAAEVRLEGESASTEEAHFFIAVCAGQMMTGAPAFLYVPTAANVLREREHHIQRLEAELATKDAWLRESQETHAELVGLHAAQTAELQQRNEWALGLTEQVRGAGLRIAELQAENMAQQTAAQAAVDGYEAEIARRDAELAEAIAWGQAREAELQGQLEASVAEYTRCMADYTNAVAEYRKCLAKFQQAEVTIEERSRWALDLQAEIDNLTAQMESIRGSRWVRLGRSLGIGPKVG